MEYINIGKIYTTHGLNGEVKVKIDFKEKDKVLKEGMLYYFNDNKECHKLVSFRKQNEYDLLLFDDITDIDVAIKYRGFKLYVNRDDIKLDIISSDLIGFECFYNNELFGKVLDVSDEGHGNNIIRINTGAKEVLIPFNNNFIKSIDKSCDIIYFNNLEGLL